MASGAFAQSQSDATIVKTPTPTGLLSPRKAMKAAARYGRAKYSYKVPKTAAKQAKYISFLSGLLTLSPAQQQQGASIFTAATVSRTALRNQVQTAHEALSEAVKTNNPSSMNQASAAIGALGAQRRAQGAMANSSFYQLLTPAQRATLAHFQSRNATA
jgi:hypothetical protein